MNSDDNKRIDFYFSWTVIPSFSPFFIIILPLFLDKSSKDFNLVLIWSIIISVLFLPGLKAIIHYFSSKPVLTLTKEGFYDYRSKLKINWADIDNLTIVYRRGPFLSIKLIDPEKYILKINNPLARFYFRIKTNIFHGTFLINLGELKGKYENIFDTIIDYLYEFKKNILSK